MKNVITVTGKRKCYSVLIKKIISRERSRGDADNTKKATTALEKKAQ